MCADSSTPPPRLLSDAQWDRLVESYLAEEPEAADRLAVPLTHHAAITVRDFLNPGGPEADDIVQDTVVGVLEWLWRRGEFEGSLLNFTISVARNRCRNYLIWARRHQADDLDKLADYLADPARGPLDTLLDEEKDSLLQKALDSLDVHCRNLLHAIYFNDDDMETLRRREGLKSLQSMYHRRAICLKKIESVLKNRLLSCSSDGDRIGSPRNKNRLGRNHD